MIAVEIDTSSWRKFGESSNAEFFEVEPHVLAVVPFDGCDDNATTASDSIRIQLERLRTRGTRAGVLVFMDRIASQDAGARAVYSQEPDPAFHACFALVGGTMFGRAVGSLFIGLRPPRVPTRMFSTVEEALTWARDATTLRK